MCGILSASGPLQEGRKFLDQVQSDAEIKVLRGVDPDHFDVDHRSFKIPAATLFTLHILDTDGSARWSAVFAFDLLRKTFDWSPLQDAARFMADTVGVPALFRDDCGFAYWIDILARALCDEADYFDLERHLAEVKKGSVDDGPDAFHERYHRMEHCSAFRSQLAEFRVVPFDELLASSPHQFRIYETGTIKHGRRDYHGCVDSEWLRVVSLGDSVGCEKRLHQFRVRRGWMVSCGPSDFARAFTGYFRSRVRKRLTPGSDQKAALQAWIDHAWVELTGESPLHRSLCDLLEAKRAEELIFNLNGESAAGLARRYTVAYDHIAGISALNDQVEIQFVAGAGPRVPFHVSLRCASSSEARALVSALAARRVTALCRSERRWVTKIAIMHRHPKPRAVCTGYTPADEPELTARFNRVTQARGHVDVERFGQTVWLNSVEP